MKTCFNHQCINDRGELKQLKKRRALLSIADIDLIDEALRQWSREVNLGNYCFSTAKRNQKIKAIIRLRNKLENI